MNTENFDKTLTQRTATLIANDLNAKKPERYGTITNKNGNKLGEYIENQDIYINVTRQPTIYPNNGEIPDVVDLVIIKKYGDRKGIRKSERRIK